MGYNVVGANWSTDEPQSWVGMGYSRVIAADGTILAKAETFVGSEIVYADLPVAPTGTFFQTK